MAKNVETKDCLTAEQIQHWRTALVSMLGPYALIMPEDQIERLREKMQEWIEREAEHG